MKCIRCGNELQGKECGACLDMGGDVYAVRDSIIASLESKIAACKAAGFIDENGEARKVNGTLKFDETGSIVAPDGKTKYFYLTRDRATFEKFPVSINYPPFQVPVFSTKEAAEAARKADM